MIATSGCDFDIILISGEPYADHPLSGVGVIARVLDAKGYRVGVIGRPDWKQDTDFRKLGRPRLFFGITSGAIDSMLANYTPLKRERATDPFAPYRSGIPDRAILVYSNKIRQLFPGTPIVIGGVEASLRRFGHYDYWQNRVRRSILLDSRADILVYGPGELQIMEIARRLENGPAAGPGWYNPAGQEGPEGDPGRQVLDEKNMDREDLNQDALDGIAGTCIVRSILPHGFRTIPTFEEVSTDPDRFCEAQKLFSNQQNLAQGHANRFVLQYRMPDYGPLDLDWIYGLPYTRKIPDDFPELAMARFSVVTHRGCLGNCSFCSLALHQGTRIISRSEDSILAEIQRLTSHPDFHGSIDDLGGPSANMYGMDCRMERVTEHGAAGYGTADGADRGTVSHGGAPCQKECLTCTRLDRSHRRLTALLQRTRRIPGVRKVFVRSGIRYDLALESPAYLKELCHHHISGCLKIAPEHVSDKVLHLMNKDNNRHTERHGDRHAGRDSDRHFDLLEEFRRVFRQINGHRPWHLKYYFMVAHPGTSKKEAKELAAALYRLRQEGEYQPIEGVQIFTPTPMTRSTCMYHTGKDPLTGEPVFVPRSFTEKKEQKKMLAAPMGGMNKSQRLPGRGGKHR
ncbi:MAG: DUF3362 domain-containing protein [bacterium]